MSEPASRRPTYEDILGAPPDMVAEIIAGVLSVQPRPAGPHTAASPALGEELGPPFKRGKGGPGGWIILDEPELHLGPDVLVPDLAGWRKTTLSHVPNAPYIDIAADWICEVLSPSTEARDRADKLPIYARERVSHVWLVNPLQRTLEILRREDTAWLTVKVERDCALIRAEPFDAIELDLSVLWADVQL